MQRLFNGTKLHFRASVYKFRDKMNSQNDSVNFAANRRDEASEGLFLLAPEEQFN